MMRGDQEREREITGRSVGFSEREEKHNGKEKVGKLITKFKLLFLVLAVL